MTPRKKGRHRRPEQPKKVPASRIGLTLTGAFITASGMAVPAVAAETVTPATGNTVQAVTAAKITPLTVSSPSNVIIVRPGNTLSELAAKYCGNPGDWSGWYAENARTIGANPNLIQVGQHLVKSCRTARITLPHSNVLTSRVTPTGKHARVTYSVSRAYSGGGNLSFAGLEALWERAGGPSWAASHAAEIAECESGGRQYAYNPSGASGYWQILGEVVSGYVFDPMVNAENAVAKFKASGDTFAQWVCR